MHQEKIGFQHQVPWQGAEKLLLLFGQEGPSPVDGFPSVGPAMIRLQFADRHQVVVSLDGGDPLLAKHGECFVREAAVADDVPQTEHALDTPAPDISQDRAESLQIRVNVGNDRDMHRIASTVLSAGAGIPGKKQAPDEPGSCSDLMGQRAAEMELGGLQSHFARPEASLETREAGIGRRSTAEVEHLYA